ncbi:MAG: methyl-accepting chemotaxis protein [Alteromonadaceae bacterium]|nr:methyl-accepting chemotaxis protein [Alteromonadaceae bacterium]|tara:strand:- start:5077 stop:6714 length:1638 start_codon:yes stop_codon:yes gene_type:complete
MSSQLSIAQRLGLGFGLILALMILITITGMERVGFIDSTLTSVSEGAALKQRYAINFRGSVHDRAIAIRDAVLVRDTAALEQHLGDVNRLAAFYRESAKPMDALFTAGDAEPAERALLDEIKATEARTLALTDSLIRLRRAADLESAREFLLEQASPAYSEWLRNINAFIDYQEEIIASDLAAVRATASNFEWLILSVTLVAIVLAMIIATLIIRNLKAILGAEPQEVAEIIRGLARGELSHRITTRFPDSVMGALKETLCRLTATIAGVRSSADELSQASAQLLSTSARNSNQIQLQTSEAEQMATAINEMAATVGEVASYASGAATAAKNADSEVGTGYRVVEETVSAIHNLAATLESASETVQQVSEDSGSIEKIIEVINAIAEQTNLLALNAAIEAARAGGHGRGFAVVADEVRSLATRTQDSTREIQDMIGKLQQGAGQAAKVMQDSRKLAQKTVDQTQLAETALGKIRTEVGAINDMNAQIASAAEQQSSVAEEVNQNINRIHEATVETAAGSDQVAESSRKLAQLADSLTTKVSFFKS